ncbi:MAG TPA: PfkB family carbohydrate kinase [Streptosporangiaceae bacterium]|nr:PfkB family carbohydrate kinase [Streptosporangiaceae bacterium]
MRYERIAVPDYLALGNPTLDVQQDGSLVLGGSAVYSALQASRLGLRSAIVGRANPADLQPYWLAYADEVDLRLQPSRATTTFCNVSAGDTREQWLRGWSGNINYDDPLPDSDILHVAPVAQEAAIEEVAVECMSRLVCLTPQGLVRRWDGSDGRIEHIPREFSSAVSSLVDVVVVSEIEVPYVGHLLGDVARHGGISVVTRGRRGCEVLTRSGLTEFTAEPVGSLVDATGAGDCFAAALTVEVFLGTSVTEAIKFASIAAALCVRGHGASAIGMRQEIVRESASWPTQSIS